ncbi:MAG: alpha/beta hydrolase family protein [Gemmatimonas sp.]
MTRSFNRFAPGVAAAVVSLVATFAGSRAAVAQAARTPARNDTVAYLYLRGADTIAVERVVSKPDGVRGELAPRGQGRVVWHQHIAGMQPTAFDLDAYAPTASPNSAPAQSVTLRIVGDSGFMDINANGASNTAQRLKVDPNTVWMLNSSVLHTEVLAGLAIRRKQDTLNVVLAQGGAQLKMALQVKGDTTIVTVAGSETRFVHDAGGLKEAYSGNAAVRRLSAADMARLAANSVGNRSSYSAPADAPYTAQDIVVNTETGFQLAGTLTHPRGTAKVPLVITISGSGEQERDSKLAPVPGYGIFREIADTLGRRGIAVLRMDDRGVGASTGRETRTVATSADYANDVREVIRYARSRSDIDASRIILLGHSEGGMIAPMVAAQNKDVSAIVLMAGNAYTGRRVMMFQNQDNLAQIPTLSPSQRDSIMKTVPAALDSLGAKNPWIGFFMQHDPLRTARQVTQPVLILQGETDRQVTPEQADTLLATFRAAGNSKATMKKFPATNHLFLADSIGVASGYAALADKKVRRSVLGELADWVVRVTAR